MIESKLIPIKLQLNGGSASDPPLSFIQDKTTGLYYNSSLKYLINFVENTDVLILTKTGIFPRAIFGQYTLDLALYTQNNKDIVFVPDGTGRVKITHNSTGSGTASLGSNCPASTLSAPYTWLQLKSSDGSLVYVPAWK